MQLHFPDYQQRAFGICNSSYYWYASGYGYKKESVTFHHNLWYLSHFCLECNFLLLKLYIVSTIYVCESRYWQYTLLYVYIYNSGYVCEKKGIGDVLFSICNSGTQGNYATQDSSGIHHLMPRWHLPEWREKEERAFVYTVAVKV